MRSHHVTLGTARAFVIGFAIVMATPAAIAESGAEPDIETPDAQQTNNPAPSSNPNTDGTDPQQENKDQADNNRTALDEVVVTAQRRSERLQDVPVAVTAYSQESIEQRDLNEVSELTQTTPGFTYLVVLGNPQPSIRGIGSDLYTVSAEPGVAVYIDDIYQGRSYMSIAAMTEIERIEVLRGPQGTLYGRNTSGGAIKFISKRPSREFTGSAGFQYGSYDQIVGHGSVAGPIIDDYLFGRITVYGEQRDGWTTNLVDGSKIEGRKVLSARASFEAVPTSWLTLTATGEIQRQRDTGPHFRPGSPLTSTALSDSLALPSLQPFDQVLQAFENSFGIVLDPLREAVVQEFVGGNTSDDPYEVYTDFPPELNVDTEGVSATADADLDIMNAKIIFGYRNSSREYLFDSDGSDIPLIIFNEDTQAGKQYSLELQLTETYDWGLTWTAGAYGFREDALEELEFSVLDFDAAQLDFLDDVIPDNIPLLHGSRLTRGYVNSDYDTTSYAVFGQVDYDLRTWLTLRLGGRWTYDRKEMDTLYYAPLPPATPSCNDVGLEKSWTDFSFKAGADSRLSENLLIYGSYAQGYKSGGFNNISCDGTPYEPETVDAFEIGIKSDWFSNRLRLNISAFRNTFEDIQVQQVDLFLTFIVNAARARMQGVEVELTAIPFANFMIDGSFSFLDAKYLEFVDDEALTFFEGDVDLSGYRLPKSPRWKGNIGLQYTFEIGNLAAITARGEWIYVGNQFFDQFNRPEFQQEAYTLWNAFVNIDTLSDSAGLQLFVKNISNEAVVNGGNVPSSVTGGALISYGAPRTWGAEVYMRF